jgi:hypothetical protein
MKRNFSDFFGTIVIAIITVVLFVFSFFYWLSENWNNYNEHAVFVFLIPIIFLIVSSYLFAYLRKKAPSSNINTNPIENNDKFHISTIFLTYLLLIYVNNKASNFLFDLKNLYSTNNGALFSLLLNLLSFTMLFVFIMVSNNTLNRRTQLSSLGKYTIAFVIFYNFVIFLLSFVI